MLFLGKTEAELQEIKAKRLLLDGEYDLEIVEWVDSDALGNPLKSKSGNQQVKVVFQTWDAQGQVYKITDYLTAVESMEYKNRHFCMAAGQLEKYEAKQPIKGIDVLGKLVKAKIGRQDGKQKDDGTFFDPKNVVKDYVKPPQPIAPKTDALPFEDDIQL